MYRQLLLKAFEKAGNEIRSDKPTRMAQHLSDYILEQSGEPYGEKSLRNHYTAAKNGETIDLKKFVANALSNYLGYGSFEEFIKVHPSQTEKKKSFTKHSKWAVAGLLVVIILAFGYNQLTKERWMTWQEDSYVEVKFDEKLLQEGKLKVYKEERIIHFKKINPDCTTTYKAPNGKALIWYGKNHNGKLEYFTSHGLHPETGKTLKELTKYMFDKHICPG